MARVLVLLVILFFAINLVVWSAIFSGASPVALVAGFVGAGAGRGGTSAPPPAPAAAVASPPAAPAGLAVVAPPAVAGVATPNPFASLPPPAARPAPAGTPIAPQAPSVTRPAPAAPPAAAAPVRGQPFTTAIRDSDLNVQINEFLARQGEPPLKDVRVQFAPDQATLTGKASVAGMAVDVRATGPVVLRNGRPAFVVESLDVGSVALPDFVRGGVVDAVNETVRRLTSDLNVDLTDVKLAPGQLIVSGRTR